MGYRLNITTKYDVQYGEQRFNHFPSEINKFLYECFENIKSSSYNAYDKEYFWFLGEFIEYATVLGISRISTNKIISYLKEQFEETDIIPGITKDAYTIKDMIDFLELALKTGDPNLEYIRLEWF